MQIYVDMTCRLGNSIDATTDTLDQMLYDKQPPETTGEQQLPVQFPWQIWTAVGGSDARVFGRSFVSQRERILAHAGGRIGHRERQTFNLILMHEMNERERERKQKERDRERDREREILLLLSSDSYIKNTTFK